jgi:autotransporter-associated beta strand protein
VVVHHNGQFSGGPTAGGPNATEVTGGDVTFTGPISTGENPLAGLTAQQINTSTTKRLIVTLANTTGTPNSYTGPTTLTTANVWLRLGADEQIPHGAGRGNVVMTGSTLDLNGFSETINGLSGSGFVENVNGQNPATLTLGAGDANNLTFSGIIFDARGGAQTSLTKVGSGTQILSGSNQYTGTTTINAGTLQIGAGSTTGSLQTSSALVTNGTLAFSRSNTVTQGTDFAAGITGSGGLRQAGTGSLVLNTANTYAGPTAIASGTLALSGEGTVGAGQVSLSTGSTFDVTAATPASIALAGGLAGSGTVNATGKTLSVGGAFAPVALSITGNVTLLGTSATSLIAGSSPATTSLAAVTGSIVNAGALSITAGEGVTFLDGQSYTFFTASGGSITAGFTSVSVGGTALTAQSAGNWTGSTGGLSYTYSETTGTLTVVSAGGSLTALETWRQENFGSTADSGTSANLADPDADGLSNLMEYALGSDPTVANANASTTVSGGNPLSLTFNTVADSSLAYIVEASNDLGTWSQIATRSGTGNPVTVQDPGPVSGNRRFLRLRVTLNSN